MDSELVLAVSQYIAKLSEENFYGDLRIKFQNGDIVYGEKIETFKPDFFITISKI